METKYIIAAVVAVIAIVGIGVFALGGGGSTQHAPNELVACVAARTSYPKYTS